MDIFTYLAIGVVVYFIYKSYKDNHPQTRIANLEDKADQLEEIVAKKAKEEFEEWLGKKGRKDNIVSDERVDELIKNTRSNLQQITEVKQNYISLKEKNKFNSDKKKLELAQDYYDYFRIRDRINDEFRSLDFVDDIDEVFKEIRELEVQGEVIVKRLAKQVKE